MNIISHWPAAIFEDYLFLPKRIPNIYWTLHMLVPRISSISPHDNLWLWHCPAIDSQLQSSPSSAGDALRDPHWVTKSMDSAEA